MNSDFHVPLLYVLSLLMASSRNFNLLTLRKQGKAGELLAT